MLQASNHTCLCAYIYQDIHRTLHSYSLASIQFIHLFIHTSYTRSHANTHIHPYIHSCIRRQKCMHTNIHYMYMYWCAHFSGRADVCECFLFIWASIHLHWLILTNRSLVFLRTCVGAFKGTQTLCARMHTFAFTRKMRIYTDWHTRSANTCTAQAQSEWIGH